MTIHIEEETKIPFLFDYKALTERVITGALDYIECPYEAEVNVLFTDNASIREINRENRNLDAATDVLSFPMGEYPVPGEFDSLEEEQPDVFHPDTGELMLGDIVISVERVMSQAEEFGHSIERELGFLLAHSILHLCGFDHIEEEDRVVMEEKQRQIMEALKLYR
ncbi:MAG: rRNA maturation RNase YbeY [Lachnospiraceae bacterium]|nr:rRNA maturation RNase YbeY [Lachnospiraceae bacterium]